MFLLAPPRGKRKISMFLVILTLGEFKICTPYQCFFLPRRGANAKYQWFILHPLTLFPINKHRLPHQPSPHSRRKPKKAHPINVSFNPAEWRIQNVHTLSVFLLATPRGKRKLSMFLVILTLGELKSCTHTISVSSCLAAWRT